MPGNPDSPELPDSPDPRIRGRIPTLTEVVDPQGWPPSLGDAPGHASTDGPPFLDLGEAAPAYPGALDGLPPLEPAEAVPGWLGHRPGDEGGQGLDHHVHPDDRGALASRLAAHTDAASALDDEAAWTEALLTRMAPQIEQIIRDAMRDAQFAALAQVRMALRSQIETVLRGAPTGEPGDGHGLNP